MSVTGLLRSYLPFIVQPSELTRTLSSDTARFLQQLEEQSVSLNDCSNPVQECLWEVLGHGPSNDKLLSTWLKDTFNFAHGISKNTDNLKNLNDLKTKIGFKNALLVLSKCYTLAFFSNNNLNLFKDLLTDLIHHNPQEHQNNELKNFDFNPHEISQTFIDQLKQNEASQKNWEKGKKMLLIASAVTLVGISILAFNYLTSYPISSASEDLTNLIKVIEPNNPIIVDFTPANIFIPPTTPITYNPIYIPSTPIPITTIPTSEPSSFSLPLEDTTTASNFPWIKSIIGLAVATIGYITAQAKPAPEDLGPLKERTDAITDDGQSKKTGEEASVDSTITPSPKKKKKKKHTPSSSKTPRSHKKDTEIKPAENNIPPPPPAPTSADFKKLKGKQVDPSHVSQKPIKGFPSQFVEDGSTSVSQKKKQPPNKPLSPTFINALKGRRQFISSPSSGSSSPYSPSPSIIRAQQLGKYDHSIATKILFDLDENNHPKTSFVKLSGLADSFEGEDITDSSIEEFKQLLQEIRTSENKPDPGQELLSIQALQDHGTKSQLLLIELKGLNSLDNFAAVDMLQKQTKNHFNALIDKLELIHFSYRLFEDNRNVKPKKVLGTPRRTPAQISADAAEDSYKKIMAYLDEYLLYQQTLNAKINELRPVVNSGGVWAQLKIMPRKTSPQKPNSPGWT